MTTYPAYSEIELDLEAPIAVLRFNRPKQLNAMSNQLQLDVIDALDRLEADDEIRAVVLCGAGRAFSAGYDLSTAQDEVGLTVPEWRAYLAGAKTYSRRVWSFRKPIIAAVHGYCLAGACEIAMMCDLTIASDDCKFGEPEIRFSSSSTMIMPWIVPPKIARELLYTGRLISAQRAFDVGMVNAVVPPDQLIEAAKREAHLLSRIAPLALQTVKEGVSRTYEIMGLLTALDQHDVLTAILDGTSTEEGDLFHQLRRDEGLRAALDWRDAHFAEVEKT